MFAPVREPTPVADHRRRPCPATAGLALRVRFPRRPCLPRRSRDSDALTIYRESRGMAGVGDSGRDVAWALKVLSEAQDRLARGHGAEPARAEGTVEAGRVSGAGNDVERIRDLERENARLCAELHMLRQNLQTPRMERAEEDRGAVRMRRHTSVKLDETVAELSPVAGHEENVDAADGPVLRGEDGTVLQLKRPQLKAACSLVVCTDRHGCEFIHPGTKGIRTSQQSTNKVKLVWDEHPRCALIIKKPHDASSRDALLCIARFLEGHGLRVLVEPPVLEELAGGGAGGAGAISTWRPEEHDGLHRSVDFVVCLGGDGTTLWASHLFPRAVPPVVSFAMGSLGFLTQFDAAHYAHHLRTLIAGNVDLSLRSRLMVRVHHASECGPAETTEVDETFDQAEAYKTVLNEVVIDRAAHSGLADLDVYCNGVFVTKVLADGVILATCTGSTAYSLAAGGSMVHPSMPAILLTPICPHTLSFRPLILSDSATIRVQIPLSTRCKGSRVAMDGRTLCNLAPGDAIVVKMSPFPLPAVCLRTENEDWFTSVTKNLHWNVREAQKPFQPAPPTPVPPSGFASGDAIRERIHKPRASM